MENKIRKIKSKIALLKIKLQKTDYQAIKFAEGEITTAEYAPIREQRRSWRSEINALEAELELFAKERTENDAD